MVDWSKTDIKSDDVVIGHIPQWWRVGTEEAMVFDLLVWDPNEGFQ